MNERKCLFIKEIDKELKRERGSKYNRAYIETSVVCFCFVFVVLFFDGFLFYFVLFCFFVLFFILMGFLLLSLFLISNIGMRMK